MIENQLLFDYKNCLNQALKKKHKQKISKRFRLNRDNDISG